MPMAANQRPMTDNVRPMVAMQPGTRDAAMHAYLTAGVYKFVFQKSIPIQIRQRIFYYYYIKDTLTGLCGN
jgi:hypothetical protein